MVKSAHVPGANLDLMDVEKREVLGQDRLTAIIGIDSQRRITALSAEACAWLGLDRAEAIGQSVEILPSPLRDVLIRSLSPSKETNTGQLLLTPSSGISLPVTVMTTALSDGERGVTGAIAVLSDLDGARRLNSNLQRLDRLASIGVLAASMAHEIKNALVAVKTFVDLLIARNQDEELAGLAGREMRRIDSLIGQMLHFGGPDRPMLGRVHLHEVLEHSLRLVEHNIEGRRIQIVRDFAAVPDTVQGDSHQLEQAFLNLFFNAMDAMGNDGELRVTTSTASSAESRDVGFPMLRVTVRDTGNGIRPENLGRLFEPFFTTKPEGTGLGLPIMRRIIQEHRGNVFVESEPNRGTTFTVLLPLESRQP